MGERVSHPSWSGLTSAVVLPCIAHRRRKCLPDGRNVSCELNGRSRWISEGLIEPEARPGNGSIALESYSTSIESDRFVGWNSSAGTGFSYMRAGVAAKYGRQPCPTTSKRSSLQTTGQDSLRDVATGDSASGRAAAPNAGGASRGCRSSGLRCSPAGR